jgi:hypothetical protein
MVLPRLGGHKGGAFKCHVPPVTPTVTASAVKSDLRVSAFEASYRDFFRGSHVTSFAAPF